MTKSALITGAAGGIGAATLARLTHEGWQVAGLDRAEMTGAGLAFKGDVTDAAFLARSVRAAEEEFGGLDAVVHAAGIVGEGPIEKVAREDWDRVLSVNLTSAFLLAQAALPALGRSKGSLVLLSSSNGLNGGSALSGPAYAVAKAGLINLGRYLAKEWMGRGIRVNCLAPGPVDTPMLDRLGPTVQASLAASMIGGRIPGADEAAAMVQFLLSDGARSLTGTVLNFSGGLVLD